MSAAAAAAAEVPLLAAVWLGTVDGSRLVGVAFLDAATRCANQQGGNCHLNLQHAIGCTKSPAALRS